LFDRTRHPLLPTQQQKPRRMIQCNYSCKDLRPRTRTIRSFKRNNRKHTPRPEIICSTGHSLANGVKHLDQLLKFTPTSIIMGFLMDSFVYAIIGTFLYAFWVAGYLVDFTLSLRAVQRLKPLCRTAQHPCVL
jgi:hypothetical protein